MRNRILLAALAAGVGLTVAFAAAQSQSPKAAGDDDKALRQAVEAYAAAFNKGDAAGVAALWAADADYISEDGKTTRGRDAIAAMVKKHLAESPGHKLKIHIKSLRFLRPDVALENGQAELITPEGAADTSRYSAIWVKNNGQWLMSSLRDLPDDPDAPAAAQAAPLKELEWMLGDWVNEGGKAEVAVACRYALERSYLVQEFHVKIKEGEAFAATVWIGWDPSSGQIKSWVFDSRGGHGEAYWTRTGNAWNAAAAGVLPDGRMGSATNVCKYVDEKSWSYQSRDRQIDGLAVPDTEVKFVRKAAAKP